MVRLAQLVFALALMFGAFLAGITIGWLRWGRRGQDEPEPTRSVPRPEPVVPRVVNRDLFSPQTDHRAAVDLTVVPFSPAELEAARHGGAGAAP